jgi:hypothetical protein
LDNYKKITVKPGDFIDNRNNLFCAIYNNSISLNIHIKSHPTDQDLVTVSIILSHPRPSLTDIFEFAVPVPQKNKDLAKNNSNYLHRPLEDGWFSFFWSELINQSKGKIKNSMVEIQLESGPIKLVDPSQYE